MGNGNRYNHELPLGIVLAAGDRKPLESPMENLRNKILPRQYFNSIERRSLLADTLSRAAKVFLRKWSIVLTGLCLAVSMTVFAPQAYSQSIRSKDEIAAVLTIENLSVQEEIVSGEVRNKAKHELRDVLLFIRYTWLWDDERNPGKTDPGTSAYTTLKQTIPPGEKLSFTFKPSPPLPKIAGGRFETSVTIAGFTEIIRQDQ
jgi:hypothetical protein